MPATDNVIVSNQTFLKRTFSFTNLLTILIVIIAVLTILAWKYKYFGFDLLITLYIQRFNVFWFDLLMKFITRLGDEIIMIPTILLVCVLGLKIRKFKATLMIFTSSAGISIIGQIIKRIIARPRPDPSLIHQIGHFNKPDSFPSGHVLVIMGFYGFLLYLAFAHLNKGLLRTVLIAVLSLPVLFIGLSRIYVGAHWFSDVLGGYLIGFVWLLVVVYYYNKLRPKIKSA